MEEYLRNIGVGLRPIDDPFFEDTYEVFTVFQRKGVTVVDDEELCHEVIKGFSCYFANCNATFHTLLDFEMHYNSIHRYACAECKKSLPTPRLLDIHIQETHDSFFQILSSRQPMYQCFISECDVKFNDAVERSKHCVTVHKFPASYRFDHTSRSKKSEPKDKMDIDEVDSKHNRAKNKKIWLNKNQKSRMFTAAAKETVPRNSDSEATPSCAPKVVTSTPSLMFVPRQVKNSYTKALTSNQSNERNVLESETIMDLAESLPK